MRWTLLALMLALLATFPQLLGLLAEPTVWAFVGGLAARPHLARKFGGWR